MHRVAVAASGGRDSTALLHCTVKAAAALGIEVVALHVHHGLHADAEAWLAQVRRQSRRWGVTFDCRRIAGAPAPGDSVEAWARRHRYAALREMAEAAGCGLVLLAHHRRDQAETWLLQALRGGGPAGLAAMPRRVERAGIVWARPWLDLPRESIERYVAAHRLRYLDDGSNADPRHARNRLRLQVWPALVGAFPDAESVLVAAAGHAQEAVALAAEVAAADLPPLLEGGGLRVAPWLALTPARRRNALATWLATALARGSPQPLLERLLDELPRTRAAQWQAPGATLRLYRGVLAAVAAPPASPPKTSMAAAVAPIPLDLGRPGRHRIAAWGGHFAVTEVALGGIPAARLAAVLARAREGGERFRLTPRGAARLLKKQYQALAVPAWQRGGPLLFDRDGRLVFVPGLGIEAGVLAAPGEPQLGLEWVPDARCTTPESSSPI